MKFVLMGLFFLSVVSMQCSHLFRSSSLENAGGGEDAEGKN